MWIVWSLVFVTVLLGSLAIIMVVSGDDYDD
jgi:hypothetical protein